MRRLIPFLALLVALSVTPSALRAQAPVDSSAPPSLSQTVLPGYSEQKDNGTLTNDSPDKAEPIGSSDYSWSQVISGTISSSSDVDYYQVTIVRPASQIKISLDGLPADYDLVLGGGQDTSQTTLVTDTFQSGLENVTQVGGSINSIGGSINSIGGSINSIGGSINSIGGSINSIGGSINSIGGSINSISAHSGTVSETIDSQLWLPGTYYIVVATNNGEYSATPYQLTVALTDSGLSAPPPAPEVALTIPPLSLSVPITQINQITTLYIYNPSRMADVYSLPITDTNLITISNSLGVLKKPTKAITAGAPPDYGVVVNLGELRHVLPLTQTIAQAYQLWDQNKANPLYANYIAGIIDNVIEAATTDGVSGPGNTTASAQFYAGIGLSPISFPNLRNVVLIGGDEVLPFYRVPDLTTIANEADYAAYLAAVNPNGAIIDPNSAQGAALRYRMLLTDNLYGADKPYRFYGFPFYLPHLAVGRIVEKPDEIARYLGFYSGTSADFVIDATSGLPGTPHKRAFVSGYDFLQDEASQIEAILQRTGLATNEFNTLNNDTWQRPDVEQGWFDGVLNTDFPLSGGISTTAKLSLSSVNAHFDHWQLLPAIQAANDPNPTFTAQRLLQPSYLVPGSHLYFGATLGYSVGCHSGYSLFDTSVPTMTNQALYQTDFPQALNSHGGNWVGNTGYGYGTADGIDYSERLAVLYTQELARKVFDATSTYTLGATIGEALVNAKQRYVRDTASLSAYDYKVVSIMNLYGLPFIRTQFTNPLAPPNEDPSSLAGAVVPLATRAPKLPNDNGRLTRTLTFTLGLTATNFVKLPRTGSSELHLAASDLTIDDEFVDQGFAVTDTHRLLRVFTDSQIGAPTLPAFAYDIGALNHSSSITTTRLKVRDVVFLGGTYDTIPNFNPQITQIVTETTTPIISTTNEPTFQAGAGLWYPAKFFGFSSVGAGEQQRDQLTAFAAQLRTDANGTSGLLRPYTQMVFQVKYEDPTITTPAAQALAADTTAPVIQSVTVRAAPVSIALAAISETQVLVTATDNLSTPLDVSATYAVGQGAWAAATFTGPSASGMYTATLPVSLTDARLVVRATDSAGNSSYYTAKGQMVSVPPIAPSPPSPPSPPSFTTWLPLMVR